MSVAFLMIVLVALVVVAVIATTVLGWVAVGRIRRSQGRLSGLGLAVFDGLLFPLLGLFAFLAWTTRQFSILVLGWPLNDPAKNTAGILVTGALFAAVGVPIVWLVWRAVNRPVSPATSSTSNRVVWGCGTALALLVLAHLAAVAGVFAWNRARHTQLEKAMQMRVHEEEAKARAEFNAANARSMAKPRRVISPAGVETANARFGPVQEGLADRSGRGGFDLDTGRFIPFDPNAVGASLSDVGAMERAHRWMQAQGIDVFGDPDSARPGLLFTAVDAAVREVDESLWNAGPEHLLGLLPPPPRTGVYTDHQTFIDAPQGTGHPKTRLIRTQQGGAAILQILEASDQGSVKFRYKSILTGPDRPEGKPDAAVHTGAHE